MKPSLEQDHIVEKVIWRLEIVERGNEVDDSSAQRLFIPLRSEVAQKNTRGVRLVEREYWKRSVAFVTSISYSCYLAEVSFPRLLDAAAKDPNAPKDRSRRARNVLAGRESWRLLPHATFS